MTKTDELLQPLLQRVEEMSIYTLGHLLKLSNYLEDFPSSGGGGCHRALLGIANHAVRVGIGPDLFLALLLCVITGTREVSDKEILDAYDRALSDYEEDRDWHTTAAPSQGQGRYRCPPKMTDDEAAALLDERDRLIRQGSGVTVDDIMAASPVMPSADPIGQFRQILGLYAAEEHLYAGDAFGRAVVPVGKLKSIARIAKKVTLPHIVPNPFSGDPAPKKGGSGLSYRCDGAVAGFRFAMAEFDDLPLDSQLAFWAQVELPIAALVYSGGKSVHAWIALTDVDSLEDWEREVEGELYAKYLMPMGVDPACRNPSRLSRTPGYFRAEKGQIQQLLYLAPEGRELVL